jgi:hypothetical protein
MVLDQFTLTRIGIVLEILSFWFAVPEILGEQRLAAMEGKLARWLGRLPKDVGITGIIMAMIFATWVRFHESRTALGAVSGTFTMMMVLFLFPFFVQDEEDGLHDVRAYALIPATVFLIAFVVGGLFLANEYQTDSWSEVGWLLWWAAQPNLLLLLLVLGITLVPPRLIRVFADNRRARLHSLLFAAVLLHTGLILQFAATFLQ